MTAMDRFQLEKEVARLDGFLSGIAVRNGKMRDYSAGAYLIELKSKDCSIEKSLKEYYEWLPDLAISGFQNLDHGMRDFEIEIRSFLVRDTPHVSEDEVLDLRRHLSFMTMEIISSAIENDYKKVLGVVRMSNIAEPLTSKCEYFCIHLEGFLIFLQFNDDIEFRIGRRGS